MQMELLVAYTKLAVVCYRLFIIFFDVVREVVDWDTVMFDVLHDLKKNNISSVAATKLERHTLFLKPRSSLGVRESAFPMTGITLTRGDRRLMSSMSISRRLRGNVTKTGGIPSFANVRVTSWRDEVQQGVYTVVSEARVTLNTGFLRKDVIILAFKVADNLLEAK